jgi:hypothetical protein
MVIVRGLGGRKMFNDLLKRLEARRLQHLCDLKVIIQHEVLLSNK